MLRIDAETFHAVIVGGGPAGAECALWLKQAGFSAMLLERNDRLGGLQLIAPDRFANFFVVTSPGRKPAEIAESMQESLNRHGAPYLTRVVDIDLSHTPGVAAPFSFGVRTRLGHNYAFKSHFLVLATGSRPRAGSFVPSERVIIGGGDKRLREGNFFQGKRVAILGGGDSAFENYAFLTAQGAQVHVYARTVRAGSKLRAQVPHEAVFPDGFDAFQETMIVCDRGDPFSRNAYDYFVVLYGFEATDPFPSLGLARDSAGFILSDDNAATSVPGVFAIGEATQRMHPCVVTSMADGVIAAKAIERAIEAARAVT